MLNIDNLPPLKAIDFAGEQAIYDDDIENIPPDILVEMEEMEDEEMEDEEDGYF